MFKRLAVLGVFLSLFFFNMSSAQAVWIWTPGGDGWFNPKNAVKDTPAEQLAFAKSFIGYQNDQDKNLPVALKEMNKLIKAYPRSAEAAEAQFYIGEIYERQGQFYQAYEAYQKVIDRYPFSERGADIVRRIFVMAKHMMEGKGVERGLFKEALLGVNEQIVEMFNAVIKNAPYGEYAPQAQYRIGLFYKEKQMHQEARDAFEKTANDYPGTQWAKSAQFQIAQVDAVRSSEAQYDQEITRVAVEGFNDFVSEFPESELSAQAKEQIQDLREKEAHNAYVIAEFYEKQEKFKAAKVYYQNVVDEYQHTSWARKALEKIRQLP